MIDIVHELRLARGRNKKEDILRKYADTPGWKNYLRAVYDQSINYGVRSVPDNTFREECFVDDLLVDLQALPFVSADKKKSVALRMSRQHGELFRLALARSLKAGVTATTINKVYPGLIPEFKVMLAKNVPTEEVRLPVLASIKFDGVRLIAEVDKHGVRLFTRSGKRLHLETIESELMFFKNGVYDGELTFSTGKQEGRTSITGAVNRCLLGTDTDIPDAVFNVFDMLSLGEWFKRKCETPYKKRLKKLMHACEIKPEHIRVVQQGKMKTHKDITDVFDHVREQGYEGLILRYKKDVYEWKRTAKLIKMKAVNHCIVECIDVIEGNGKYDGMIGSLVCEGFEDNKLVTVNVGTGLSDHDRELNPDEYIGKLIDIEYNDLVKAKNADHYSLFLPVFKRIHKEYDT